MLMTLDSRNVTKYAGKDLGTILEEIGPEEGEEAAPDGEEHRRNHSRFTADETEALCGLLCARGRVPAKKDLIEWVRRQGTGLFVGRSPVSIRSKLHHLARKLRLGHSVTE